MAIRAINDIGANALLCFYQVVGMTHPMDGAS